MKIKPLIIGCGYRVDGRDYGAIQCVLKDVSGGEVTFVTRHKRRGFKAKAEDIRFIRTHHNIAKARRIIMERRVDKRELNK